MIVATSKALSTIVACKPLPIGHNGIAKSQCYSTQLVPASNKAMTNILPIRDGRIFESQYEPPRFNEIVPAEPIEEIDLPPNDDWEDFEEEEEDSDPANNHTSDPPDDKDTAKANSSNPDDEDTAKANYHTRGYYPFRSTGKKRKKPISLSDLQWGNYRETREREDQRRSRSMAMMREERENHSAMDNALSSRPAWKRTKY